MLTLNDRAAVSRALNDLDLSPDLRALIGRRAWQLFVDENRPSRVGVRFVVVEGGDTPEVINWAVRFPITGEHAEARSFSYIEDHGFWFEIGFRRGDLRTVVFVENGPGTELGIHQLCLSHFWPDQEEDR